MLRHLVADMWKFIDSASIIYSTTLNIQFYMNSNQGESHQSSHIFSYVLTIGKDLAHTRLHSIKLAHEQHASECVLVCVNYTETE